MKKVLLSIMTVMVIGVCAARAEDKIETKVSGVIFASYEYVLSDFLSNGTPASNLNSFDTGRVQLNFSSKFNEKLNSNVQLETNQVTRDNKTNVVYIKQAYLEWKDIYKNASLLFGMIPLGWIDFEQGIWKNRFVAKLLVDENSILNSNDRGIKIKGTLPMAFYEVMLVNGEGYGARLATGNEINKFKDAIARIAFSPVSNGDLQGLKINAYIQRGQNTAVGEDIRNRLMGGVSYESKPFNAMGTYISSEDTAAKVKGAGFSVHGNYCLTDNDSVFALYDSWDPDTDAVNDARTRAVGGISHKLADTVKVALAYTSSAPEKESLTAKTQNILSTNVEIKF